MMSLFPADPPDSLDDQASIVANDWNAFSALSKLTDHWSRPAWPDGARALYWMIIPRASEPLHDLAARVQEEIRPLGNFDPVPLDWLHLTLHRVGPVDGIGDSEIHALAERAETELANVESFDLQVGPIAGSAGAIRFSVSPWTELTLMYAKVAAIGFKPDALPRKGIRPHLSVAYSNQERPAAPVISAIEALRVLRPVPVTIADIHLVELRRDGSAYFWKTLRTLLLKG